MSEFRPKVQFLDLVTAHQRCLCLFLLPSMALLYPHHQPFLVTIFYFQQIIIFKTNTKNPRNNGPLSAKKFTNFRGVQFFEGLTKWYLPWSNFKGEIFNNKTYISLAVLGGSISWIAMGKFLGGIHELHSHLKPEGVQTGVHYKAEVIYIYSTFKK